MSHGEVLRAFDLHREDPARLIELKEAVYRRPVDRAAFEWEYHSHPRSAEIRVFVVEHERRLVAATTRLPATFRLDGADHPAFFNIDSMVHPEHRRKGRMRDLYQLARASLPAGSFAFSKGSSSQIYPLLLSIGHREILPNTYLVSYPSAARWLMSRLHLRSPGQRSLVQAPAGFEDFLPIHRFGDDFDAFFQRVAPKHTALFVRDAAQMNWRYVDIPHRSYLAFRRVSGGETTSVVVLSVNGEHGHVVDVLWDPDVAGEPDRCVRFAQAVFDEQQVVRVVCFATHPRLRDALTRAGFFDRGETPRFSAYVPPALEDAFDHASGLHVVDGDGDTEFS